MCVYLKHLISRKYLVTEIIDKKSDRIYDFYNSISFAKSMFEMFGGVEEFPRCSETG